MAKDTLRSIARDAFWGVKVHIKKVAAMAAPHVTLDNAVKVGEVINALLDAKAKLRPPKA